MIDSRVLERWGLSAPSAVDRLGGTNNLSWRIQTADGSYILRFYQNAGNLRLRSAVSVIHRLGRWKAGLASIEDVASRMREGLRMDEWFRAHADELLRAIVP